MRIRQQTEEKATKNYATEIQLLTRHNMEVFSFSENKQYLI
jgi:hypothetical protein